MPKWCFKYTTNKLTMTTDVNVVLLYTLLIKHWCNCRRERVVSIKLPQVLVKPGMLLLLPDPFWSRDGGICIFCMCSYLWRKTMVLQNPGSFPGPGPEVVREERAVQIVRSWTVQNEMRGVLGLVSTGAARRILDSVNPKEVRAQQ